MNFIKPGTDLAGHVTAVEPIREAPAERRWPISYASVERATVMTDAAIILITSILAGVTYHLHMFDTPGDVVKYAGLSVVVIPFFVSLMKTRGMYKPAELLVLGSQIRTICLLWTSVFLVLAASVFTLKIGNELSRGATFLFATLGLAALIAHRIFWRNLLNTALLKNRFSTRKIILLTDYRGSADPNLPQILINRGFRLERHFMLPPPGLGTLGREAVISEAIACVRHSDVEEIVIGADLSNWAELRSMIAELRILPFPVNLVPVGAASEILKYPCRDLGNAVSIEVQRGPLNAFEFAAKRCIDIAIAGIALLSLSPLLATVAIAIKLDSPGPILFRQRRCGLNGRYFQILKFRTMSVLEDGASITQAQRFDGRVTRLGKWLRRTSIDELPQLLNVLEGSMALVGPRPHAVAHDNHFDNVVRNYAFRQRVKPGLTGWAQVHGYRGPTSTPADIERRVEHDLWYIDNWSFRLDFAILLQTIVEVVRSRNAY